MTRTSFAVRNLSRRKAKSAKRNRGKNRVSLMQQLEDRRMLAVASQPAITLPTVDDPVAVGIGTFDNDAYNDAVVLGSAGDLTVATGGPNDAWQTISNTNPGLGPQNTLVAERLSADPFTCLLYTSPSPRDQRGSRMPSSA